MDALLIPAAFGLGAVHALEPGHGKTLVTTYLVGNRGRKRDAWILGGVVAVSHTVSVLTVALLATWVLSSFLDTHEDWLRWVEVFSGGLILTVGGLMLWRSFRPGSKTPVSKTHGDETETCLSGHASHCSHQALALKGESESSLIEILMLGLASGLCPSPLPLVMLTSAMVAGELHDLSAVVGYLLTFSVGLAFVVVLLGLSLIGLRQQSFQFLKNKMTRRFSRFSLNAPQVIRVLSSVLIMGLGGYLVFQALWGAPDSSHQEVSTLHSFLPVH